MSHYQKLYELPKSWQWCQLGNFTDDLQYGTSEKSVANGEVAVLRIGNITRTGEIDYANLAYTSSEADIEKYSLRKGDLLFNRTNSSDWVGKTAFYDEKVRAIYAGYLIRIRPIHIDSEYLNIFMNSDYYRRWCQSVKTDAVNQSNINAQKLSHLWCPIPPLEEQKRITERVKDYITKIVLIEKSSLDVLNSIGHAKSKILELAMQGKLVPQDPADEPAADMLRRVNPKARIITDNPHSRNLPNSWCEVRIIDLFHKMEREIPSGQKFKYIDIDSIDNKTNIAYPKEIEVVKAPSRASRHTKKGDIVFSMVRPYLRNIAKVPFEGCIASTGFYVFSPTYAINKEFAFQLLLSPIVVNGLNTFMKGDNSPSINKDNVENYVVPLPPLNEQLRICERLGNLYQLLDEIETSLQS